MNINEQIDIVKNNVDEINRIMAELYTQGVEIRIAYKDPEGINKVPRLDLWRAIQHINLLKNPDE